MKKETDPFLIQIKAQAKELKKQTDLTHCQAINAILKQHGFNSINHYKSQKEKNETQTHEKI